MQFLLASALGLFLLVGLLNLVVVQYGKGAIQSALEQGVRAGSVYGDARDCLQRIDVVLRQLLAGRMSDDLVVQCESSGDLITASARATFDAWTPLTSDFHISLSGQARIEPP